MISIKNLFVYYNTEKVLENFSAELNKGEIYSLIGPSGCGKSTLLKVLCGIKKDYSGEITFNDKPIKSEAISIGYVPQNYGLLAWKTVYENIYLPLKLDKKKQINETEVNDILNSLEIRDILNKYPSELSGGQKQRVALARAFIARPDLLLMDEPFSALDAFTSSASQELFLRIWSKYKVTTLFITHNIAEATSIGKHILLMDKAERKIFHQVENEYFGLDDKENEKVQLAIHLKTIFEKEITKTNG